MEELSLSRSKHSLIVQETCVSDLVFSLEFAKQILLLPIKHGKMTFAPCHQQIPAISSGINPVRSKIRQRQVKYIICVLGGQDLFEIVLRDFESALPLSFRLDEASVLSIEVLVVFLKAGGCFVFQNARLSDLGFKFTVFSH